MAFEAAGFGDDALISEIEVAEVVGEGYSRQESCGAGAAAHAEGDFVVDG